MPQPKFNTDQMHNAPLQRVAQTTMGVLNAIQDEPAHIQVLAAGALFHRLTQHYAVSPRSVFTAVENIINGAEGRRPEFKAVDAYIQNEL